MSLQIIKAGIFDTIQDCGRVGCQHLGINPGGAMDKFSAQLGNALLGKDLNSPVIEMHFPAPKILFEQQTIICITGADFSPVIGPQKIPLSQPVIVNKNSLLQFEKLINGSRCYLSILHYVEANKWLNSYSTNLKAEAGGFCGRLLKKGDVIHFKNDIGFTGFADNESLTVLSCGVQQKLFQKNTIRFIKGSEWNLLSDESCKAFEKDSFAITNTSDRMGYRLFGQQLKVKETLSMVSSAVTFGTIQLLPDGQLIVLMADHQTTGGYPRIGNVITADLHLLAQKKAGEQIIFSSVEINIAEEEFIRQQKYLQQLQSASKFKLEKFLHAL